jgi:hypothetical protein
MLTPSASPRHKELPVAVSRRRVYAMTSLPTVPTSDLTVPQTPDRSGSELSGVAQNLRAVIVLPDAAKARVIKGFLTNARPPAGGALVGRWTLDTFAGLRVLRACVRQVLSEPPIEPGGGYEDLALRLAIVATELAANAMAHTGPPTTVRLFRTATTYLLEVADNDPWLVPRITGERFSRTGGLGLQLARKLSLDMGWFADAGTKYVWAQVAILR